MQLVDHVLMLLLFVAQPIQGALESRYYLARAKAGEPLERTRFYRQTTAVEWLFLLLLIAAWFDAGRPIEDLGFVISGGAGFWAGVIFCIAVSAYLLYSWRTVKTANAAEKMRYAESLGELVHFLPQTKRELHNFYLVSVTAGIVEEIVYRGFVLWYFSQYMPLWGAVVASSVAFGLGHSYQGARGALRISAIGLALGTLYVVSGSIWLPIIAHVLADILQGAAIFELLRKDDRANGAIADLTP